jgi:RNA-directed DNA polymerase
VLIRYADDALALCHSRDQAQQVKARLAAWLKPRGLAFNEAKTAIVCLDDGVDFLGATRSRTVRVSALEGGMVVTTAA